MKAQKWERLVRVTCGRATGAALGLCAALGVSAACGTSEEDDSDESRGDDDSRGDGSSDSDAGDEASGDGDGDGDGSQSGDGDGDGDGDDPEPGVTERLPVETKASAGCGTLSPEEGQLVMTVDGTERGYLVSLPDNYDPAHAYPLIFAFHGQGNSGEGVSNQWYFGVEQKGGTPAIFVYPDGLEHDDGTGWPKQDGRDVAFFDAMLKEFKSGYCVDENRVFSTGHSYGGIMTFTLACERAEVLRAVAPVAGARWANSACSGPVAAWGAHGNPDMSVGYDLGVTAMARILSTNGCDVNSVAPFAPEDTCISYACDAGYPVYWCEHDQGHDWPDFAAQSIKDFFDSF